MSSYRFLLAAGVVALILSSNSFAASGDAAFDEGINAFKSKNFDNAIQAFERAKSDGMQSSLLHYNLGVSYYKTGQYQNAVASFLEAMHDTKLHQLSQYNLGLVYLKLERNEDAVGMFRRASENNSSPRVTKLANKMLEKHAPDKRKLNLSGLFSFAYGNDDNVTQTSTNSPTNIGDNYLTTFAFIDVPFQSLTLNASIFVHDYQDLDTEDLMLVSAGILVPVIMSDWRITPSLHLSRSKLNSVNFQKTTDFKLAAETSIDKNSRLAFRYSYSDIDFDGTTYDYLLGDRQQYRVDYKTKTSAGKIRVRYELETNNRQNLTNTNYSPTRHTLRMLLKRPLFNATNMDVELSFRDSEYDPAAVSGSPGSFITRSDKRKQFRLNIYNQISSDWTVGLRYIYTDNDSNLSAETYTRADTQAYANWVF